jgi:hypothetical protein
MIVAASTCVAQIEDQVSEYAEDNGEGYLMPLADAMGSALNGGLWHSAYIPDDGIYFSVETRLIAVYFDDEQRTFTYTPGDADNDPIEGADLSVPTVVGDPEGGLIPTVVPPEIAYVPGFDINSFAIATPQIRIGGFRGTELIIRYIAFDAGDVELGNMSLLGLGGRHSISQYLDPEFPVDIAAGFFWQSFQLGDELIDAQAMTFGVQGSKRFPAGFAIIEPYVGIGYDMFSMDVTYECEDDCETETINLEMESDAAARFTFGLHIKAAFLDLNGEYNIAGQNGFALGLGFAFGG